MTTPPVFSNLSLATPSICVSNSPSFRSLILSLLLLLLREAPQPHTGNSVARIVSVRMSLALAICLLCLYVWFMTMGAWSHCTLAYTEMDDCPIKLNVSYGHGNEDKSIR